MGEERVSNARSPAWPRSGPRGRVVRGMPGHPSAGGRVLHGPVVVRGGPCRWASSPPGALSPYVALYLECGRIRLLQGTLRVISTFCRGRPRPKSERDARIEGDSSRSGPEQRRYPTIEVTDVTGKNFGHPEKRTLSAHRERPPPHEGWRGHRRGPRATPHERRGAVTQTARDCSSGEERASWG